MLRRVAAELGDRLVRHVTTVVLCDGGVCHRPFVTRKGLTRRVYTKLGLLRVGGGVVVTRGDAAAVVAAPRRHVGASAWKCVGSGNGRAFDS